MTLSILCILYLAALISTIVSIIGRCPLYVPVLFIAIGLTLSCLSLR